MRLGALVIGFPTAHRCSVPPRRATACCPCAGGRSTEPVEEIEELGDLFEDLDTVAMHWASAVVPSAGELRHGLLDEQRERRHPPVAQPANRAIDLPQTVRVSACWRGVASALLQNLDQDLFFEQWRPPPALFAGLNLRGLPQHGIGRTGNRGALRLRSEFGEELLGWYGETARTFTESR